MSRVTNGVLIAASLVLLLMQISGYLEQGQNSV